VRSSKELTDIFFKNLKDYNSTNFKTLEKADLSKYNAVTHKAFSSVLTRYFIFIEKNPEITDEENKVLYFKLKLDMIGTYFSQYPESDTNYLRGFQLELRDWIKEHKEYLEDTERATA